MEVNKERARALVTAALARAPKLTAHGLHGHYGAVAKWGRAYLLSDAGLDDVEACARWLEERRERWPQEWVTRGRSGERREPDVPVGVVAGWIQRSTGRPIRGGVLLAAALGLGWECEGYGYLMPRPPMRGRPTWC